MNNINIIENATSQSNLVTTPIEVPFSIQSTPLFSSAPSPSHPPPLHTTLPVRHKHTVVPMSSNDGSVTSSTALIRKGRAATIIGKLKIACTPTEENCVLPGACKFETGPVYKSLIVRNREETPIYATTSPHGSMESLNHIEADDQPVYTEPTVPLSVSMLSLVSEPCNQLEYAEPCNDHSEYYSEPDDEDQPEYTEPFFIPHSYSSYSLHSPTEKNSSLAAARTRLSLPLNRKLAVSPFLSGTEEQPVYTEVYDWIDNSTQKQQVSLLQL